MATLYLNDEPVEVPDGENICDFIEELGVPIDSAGACLKNIEIPRELNANKAALMRKYRVYLAFENVNLSIL